MNRFETYCLSITEDWEGGEIYPPYSSFIISSGQGFAECKSVCTWDEEGRPKSGHALFSVMWTLDIPREVPYASAGVFKMQPQCGITASITRFFGLEAVVF